METEKNNQVTEKKYSFNLDELNKVGNNSQSFLEEMLTQFSADIKECSNKLKEGLEEDNSQKINRAAHKAISSYSILELTEYVELLRVIEAQAYIEINAKLKDDIELFNKKNEALKKELSDYLKEMELKKLHNSLLV
jgi:HPt (histidine-containing phosphotransfer) domain-containing protein